MLPVVFRWDAHALCMRAEPRYRQIATRQFHEGEEYPLVVLEARSRESHNHYFAAVNEGWHNLPENVAARFPSAEHLRKWCLTETKWSTEEEYRMPTKPYALLLARLVRKKDEYARITIGAERSDPTTGELYWPVLIREAMSQSAAAMGKEEFEASKKAVLDIIASMVGVRRTELDTAARRRA